MAARQDMGCKSDNGVNMKFLIARFDAWLDSGGRWPAFVQTAILAVGFAAIVAAFKIMEG